MLKGIRMPLSACIGRSCRIVGNVKLGENVHIGDDVKLNGNVIIGNDSYIDRGVEIYGNVKIGSKTTVGAYTTLSTSNSGELVIGDDVLINTLSVISACKKTVIEDHCIFAAFVQITDSTHCIDNVGELIKHAEITSKPVMLAKNVWLGSSVVITQGVTIGTGAVIGANSMVNKDIPEYVIAGGSPAKIIKSRVPEGIS